MLHNLGGWHALVILAVVMLLFGAAKLPALAKSLGQSMRILKSESAAESQNDETTPAAQRETAVSRLEGPIEGPGSSAPGAGQQTPSS